MSIMNGTIVLTNLRWHCLYLSWEVYWDEPKGVFTDLTSPTDVKDGILRNLVQATKLAGVKHVVCVDNHQGSIMPLLETSGVPYTCIRTPGGLTDTPNYTFQQGLQGDLVVTAIDCSISASSSDDRGQQQQAVCREDLAALCVQCLQSLSWDQSRRLSVSCAGSVQVPSDLGGRPKKRVDQQWCVNSFVLEDKLAGIA